MIKWRSFLAGFVVLFFVYHFPEFFQSFWITAVFKIGFLAVAILLSRFQGWKGLAGYGFSFTNNWYAGLLIGLVVGVSAFAISIAIAIGFQFERFASIQSIQFFFNSLPFTLLMTFFPSIAEDILTRGYFYGHLKFLRPVVWVLLSATIYVLNHIWRLDDGLPVLSYLFLLGLVLAVTVIGTRSLWLALGIHWGANIAFELSNSGLKLVITGNPKESTWSLAAVWGLVLVILMLVHRRRLKQSKE